MTISGARGTAASFGGCSNVTVESCTISNAGSGCLSISGSDNMVKGNTVFGCGGSGISLSGGDIKSLVSSNTSAVLNHVYNFSRIRR